MQKRNADSVWQVPESAFPRKLLPGRLRRAGGRASPGGIRSQGRGTNAQGGGGGGRPLKRVGGVALGAEEAAVEGGPAVHTFRGKDLEQSFNRCL